jgi:hypothetical protein
MQPRLNPSSLSTWRGLPDLGGEVLALSPADFAKLIAEETEKWGKVIRTANIKPD